MWGRGWLAAKGAIRHAVGRGWDSQGWRLVAAWGTAAPLQPKRSPCLRSAVCCPRTAQRFASCAQPVAISTFAPSTTTAGRRPRFARTAPMPQVATQVSKQIWRQNRATRSGVSWGRSKQGEAHLDAAFRDRQARFARVLGSAAAVRAES